jgi:hypothetical protein
VADEEEAKLNTDLDVVKDWEKVMADLRQQVQNDEKLCHPLMKKVEQGIKREKEANGHGQ